MIKVLIVIAFLLLAIVVLLAFLLFKLQLNYEYIQIDIKGLKEKLDDIDFKLIQLYKLIDDKLMATMSLEIVGGLLNQSK